LKSRDLKSVCGVVGEPKFPYDEAGSGWGVGDLNRASGTGRYISAGLATASNDREVAGIFSNE
jgi:hypothetical protein